ncbi:MAG: tRNA pseudouridine(38-40) synthase TruA [Moheibacter sp.]
MRYFLELAYSGKNYFGWQIQPKQISVQEVLQNALSTLLRSSISIIGAGRTDTGVHAKKMFAHFDYEKTLPINLVHRLNAFLPKDIVIHKIHSVKSDAHARFDATERTYHYLIQLGKDVFNFEQSWQINQNLNIEWMNSAAERLIGKKDFSSFAKLHTDVKTHICDVKFAKWNQDSSELKFTITADRFLRNMVRAIVGTLVDVGKGKISLEEFSQIIDKKDRSFASASAPAAGLFLVDVIYPNCNFINE